MAEGDNDIELEEVAGFLQEMNELKLMYEEEGCYLSLAVAANPRTQPAMNQSNEVVMPVPQFVQLQRQVEV